MKKIVPTDAFNISMLLELGLFCYGSRLEGKCVRQMDAHVLIMKVAEA